MKPILSDAVKAYLSQNGKKGGSVKSEKKANAARKNGCAPCSPGKSRGRRPWQKSLESHEEIMAKIKLAESIRLRNGNSL